MKISYSERNTISKLIEDLESNFPNNIPINCSPTIEDFRKLQGHQEVIQYLRNLIGTDEPE